MSKLVHNYTFNGSSTTDEYGTQLVLNRLFNGDVIEGFLVVANGTPNMTVRVNPGSGRITTGTYPSSYGYLISHDTAAGESVTISAAAASPRIDYIVGYIDRTVAGSTAPTDVNNTNNVLKFIAVAGTPAGSPNPPTVAQIQTATSNNPYIILAQVAVGAGVVLISNGNISDMRTFASLAINASGSGGWINLSASVSAVTYNGNRSYDLTTTADSTGIVSPGMRLRMTRTVAVPTQSASLNGSTQSFSKASPANMTFTNNFVVSAWIKLGSYSTTRMCIASRKNATNGWYLGIDNGRVVAYGLNGASGNYSDLVSVQAIPLNKWVHIAIQLDMATFTATPTTSYIMIDGVDVPAIISRGGTNPTSLVQAGNLEIGSQNGGTELFNGKVAQVAIYNSKVTQAAVRATISQSLLGTEASLISAFSLSNSLNDLVTASANNLTANGSATTTNNDAPWGQQSAGSISTTVDYGIVQKVTSTTITLQVPEGNTVSTVGVPASIQYGTVKSPYGMPTQKDKWSIYVRSLLNNIQSSPTANVWYQTSAGTPAISIPVGEWNVRYDCALGVNTSASAGVVSATLSTSSSSETIKDFTAGVYMSAANTLMITNVHREAPQSVAAVTTYYHIFRSDTTVNNISVRSDISPLIIAAENAYI